MEKFKEKFLNPVISVIPFSIIKQTGHGRLIILYYHIVNDVDVSHVVNLYKYKGIGLFCDDLEFLGRHYNPVKLLDVIEWVKGKKILPPNPFLLTFDDGFREIYDVISPILLNKGIPATFFISSAFLDNKELCYKHKVSILVENIEKGLLHGSKEEIENILNERGICFNRLEEGLLKVDYKNREILEKIANVLHVDFQKYLIIEKPYLTSDQVKDLIKWGFEIGAHSIDHPYYSDLSLTEQLEQTILSVKEIREKFLLDYGAFAFPHNDTGVSSEFFKKIEETSLIDITFGTGGMVKSGIQTHKQRINLENPKQSAKEIVSWQYIRRLYRQFMRI